MADLSAALARLLRTKASAVAWAARNCRESEELQATAARAYEVAKTLTQESKRLVRIAEERLGPAA